MIVTEASWGKVSLTKVQSDYLQGGRIEENMSGLGDIRSVNTVVIGNIWDNNQ